jgi:protein gp37
VVSHIEWTDATWNPVTGCTKISPACKFCYAERLANRLQAMGQQNYRNGFNVTLQPHMIEHPLRWRQPRRVFVNSMSDLFHDDVPASFILQVFDVMKRASWHQYQVLTKRSERLLDLNQVLDWRQHYLFRIDHLRKTGAHIKFLSVEPLLGSLRKLNLRGIDWAIVGGDFGPGARPMDPEWVREIRDRCLRARVPFFFKQWGGVFKVRNGRTLDSRLWDEMPVQERAKPVPSRDEDVVVVA